MIRYPVTEKELNRMIDEAAPGWRKKASDRTLKFRETGRYSESSSCWSEVKEVYMNLQHCKCAYCERKLEGKDVGKIEHDIEHFRPKSGVRKWPPAGSSNTYDFPTGDDFDEGYFLLAYHPLNYATACKSCNSTLKSNYFPVAGARGSRAEHPKDLKSERCYLIYPIGSADADPESLITFDGLIPVPRARRGHRARRARIVIDFFQLQLREHLLEERARGIMGMYFAMVMLRSQDTSEIDRDLATGTVSTLLSSSQPHSSCIRAFHQLCLRDFSRAREIATVVQGYLSTRS